MLSPLEQGEKLDLALTVDTLIMMALMAKAQPLEIYTSLKVVAVGLQVVPAQWMRLVVREVPAQETAVLLVATVAAAEHPLIMAEKAAVLPENMVPAEQAVMVPQVGTERVPMENPAQYISNS